jgi:glycosyltransferase involved in cell wall biosynthesis
VRDRLRVVFICQAIDRDDPLHASAARWAETLAGKPSVAHVRVLALRTGRYDPPAFEDVYRFGRSNRLVGLAAFYRGVARSLRPRPDVFFVHQGGPYPALLLPFKLLMRIPIVHWKAHPVITPAMAFYARFCDDLILTSASAAFPMELSKVRVVGQGVDVEFFRPQNRPHLADLIAVGRIAPAKGPERMITAVAHANRTFGTTYRFNLYGPTLAGRERYRRRLEELIDRLGAREWVTLHGPVIQEELPALLNAHRASINFSTGAVDRSAVEAMACGLPLISNNDAVAEIMPADLRPALIADKKSTHLQAQTIHELLSRPETEIARLGERMRTLVVADHSIEPLFDRILEQIRTLD